MPNDHPDVGMPSGEHEPNGSPPHRRFETFLRLMAARISALFASGQHQVHRALDSASRWFERATASRKLRIVASIAVSTRYIVILAGAICYLRYSHLIDARLKDGPFGDSVNIYAAP